MPEVADSAQGAPLPAPGWDLSTALLTDHYELTMVDAALRSGVAHHRAVFELWARNLPPGRRYGVVAGTARAVAAISGFRFGEPELDFLARHQVVSPRGLEWLAGFRFRGDIDGYAEGELYFPGSPVLTVSAPFAEAVLLETLLLSVLNHDSAVASAAARMVDAAQGTPIIEMGSRRTHEESAVAAARAAHLVGVASTSNLQAGRRFGVPTAGTVAHAFVMAHDNELDAFVAQLAAQGIDTTILVDTYDIPEGIRHAVRAAQQLGARGPGAIRIDAGDLLVGSREARALLDSLGAQATRIVVSGDLDEYRIEGLEQAPGGRAPIDAYGVGTSLVTGSGHPTAGFIYKLVAIAGGEDPANLRPVHKDQEGKATLGGRKLARRRRDASNRAVAEVLQPHRGGSSDLRDPAATRRLQVPLLRRGEPTPEPTMTQVRSHHAEALAELAPEALVLAAGEPALVARLSDETEEES